MSDDDVRSGMDRFTWYHTVELRPGIMTNGQYDHRPFLEHYGIPADLSGKTVLDVGPAHGFFAFELESRGAERVVTLELPRWSDHDGSAVLKADFEASSADDHHAAYLRDALAFAIAARGSRVEQQFGNVYDLNARQHGVFDIVFCASMLLHITDPLRALYAIRDVTGEMAIIATMIDQSRQLGKRRPMAAFLANPKSQVFWAPNRLGLEAWATAAGFASTRWVSEFALPTLDGEFNTPHGTIHAFPA